MGKKVLMVSDYSFKGSGYLNIVVPLSKGLAELGHEVKAIGFGYQGEEHNFPFSILSCMSLNDGFAMINNLKYLWGMDVVIVAMDIPQQEKFASLCKSLGVRMIAITPLENPPLTFSWANMLQQIDKVFFISQLGADEAVKAGVDAKHLIVGMDTESWRLRTAEEYQASRKMLNISDDTLVILTVADNQERKNLSKAFEIVSKVKNEKKVKVKYILVTRENSEVGWKLRDLAMTYNIASELMIFERGLPFKELYSLYAMSDVALLTSKAEGLCCLPNQEIWTTDGIKFIDEIQVGDTVISHTGEARQVFETFERDVEEEINQIDIGFGLDSLKLTDNHKVLGAKRGKRKVVDGVFTDKQDLDVQWFDAQDLKKFDYVFFPEIITQDVDSIYPSSYLEGVCDFGRDGDVLRPLGKNQTGFTYFHPTGKSLPADLPITTELMESIGWYISEGCDTRSGLSFSLNTEEVDFQSRIKYLMKSLYDVDVIDNFKERHRYDGRVLHTFLGRFYSSMCGDGAHNKHIPDWAMYLPDHKLWPMVEALFSGDGTIDFKLRTLRYSTVSRKLAKQLQQVLLKLGVVASFREAKNRVEFVVTVSGDEISKVPFVYGMPKAKKHQQQFAKVDGGWLFPVRLATKVSYSGKVYNLEVETDHSYLTTSGVVHNCMPVMEAMSTGVPVVATNCGSLPELLAQGRGWLMETEYSHIDPWGNSRRDFPDAEDGVRKMMEIVDRKQEFGVIFPESIQAREYMKSRNWNVPINQVHEAIEELTNEE